MQFLYNIWTTKNSWYLNILYSYFELTIKQIFLKHLKY